jgi:ComEC/Rec2-related protein
MLMWWAVFFVSGSTLTSRYITHALVFLPLLLSVRSRHAPRDGHRLLLFVLCASTSLVIWTAALRPERQCPAGPLTGGVPSFATAARGYMLDSLDDLIAALLFGSRDRLDRDLRESYGYLGIAHFLALSGLHLGILSIPLVWAAAYLPIGRVARAVFILTLITCYSILAGLPPSLVRATALAAVFMIQRLFGRKTTLARSLALAVFALVLIDEQILHSGGFQLSCTAVLAIALLGLPLMRQIRSGLRGKIVSRIATLFLTPAVITVSVNILTLPFLLMYFGRAPLLAPAYNLLMIVPVTLLLYLGLAYAVLPIGPIRAIVALPINLITDFMWDVPLRFSTKPQPEILSGSLCWPFYLAGTALLIVALRPGCRRRIIWLCTAPAFLVASYVVGGGHDMKGVSSSVYSVQEPRDLSPHTVLLSDRLLVIEKDIGRWEAERVVRVLWKMGIGSIETLLLCPARLGRRGGVRHIVSRIRFTEVICSPYLVRYDDGLIEVLQSRRIGTVFIERCDSLEAGGKKIRLIAPHFPPQANESVPVERARIRFELSPSDSVREFEN